MNRLSKGLRRAALRDLGMYFGRPPYDVEYVRRAYCSAGFFAEHALEKYGRTPGDLIRELQAVYMTEKTKSEAFRDLKIYLGEPPIIKEALEEKLASGEIEMRVEAKYFMTIDDLMNKVGFEVVD